MYLFSKSFCVCNENNFFFFYCYTIHFLTIWSYINISVPLKTFLHCLFNSPSCTIFFSNAKPGRNLGLRICICFSLEVALTYRNMLTSFISYISLHKYDGKGFHINTGWKEKKGFQTVLKKEALRRCWQQKKL